MNENKWGAGIPKYRTEDLMLDKDIHEFACRVVAGSLESEGYNIEAFNPVLGSYPSIIAINDKETIAVVVLGAVAPERPKLKLTDKFGIIGYCDGYQTKPCCACVSIGSSDPERFEESLALKEDEYLVNYEGIEYISKDLPSKDTEEYKIFVMQFIGGYLRAKNYKAVEEYIAKDCIIENSIAKENIDDKVIEYLKKVFADHKAESHCIIKSVGNYKTLNVEKLFVKGYSDGQPGTVKILQEADKIGLLIVTETPAFDNDDNGIIFNVDFDKKGKINKINIIDPRYYEFTAYEEDTDPKENGENFENSVNLRGYITKKPIARTLESGTKCATFTLGVRRSYKNNKGTYDYDYINILCWRKLAEKVLEYEEDNFVRLEGHLQTRSYTTENNEKRFVTEVYCTSIEKIEV